MMQDDLIGHTPPEPPPVPVEHRLIELDRLRVDQPVFVECAGKELAVVRRPDGGVVVLDNTCPHAGGNLAGGTVEDNTIICPWHQWTFDLTTGRCTHSPTVSVRRYATTVRSSVVFVTL